MDKIPPATEVHTLGTRLGITLRAWTDLDSQSRAIIRASCLRKVAWSKATAHQVALRMTLEGTRRVTAYRCPFVLDGHDHYHVGRVTSMRSLQRIALAIRDLHHNRPPRKIPA